MRNNGPPIEPPPPIQLDVGQKLAGELAAAWNPAMVLGGAGLGISAPWQVIASFLETALVRGRVAAIRSPNL